METVIKIPDDVRRIINNASRKIMKEWEAEILEDLKNNPEGYVKWSERLREIDKPCRIKLC